jgi:short-subunit dehydrogenase
MSTRSSLIPQWALVTGASAGIGQEFARVLASEHYHLVLTARRKDRLLDLQKELHEKFGILVEIFVCDLSHPQGAREIFEWTRTRGLEIDVLINNAGFGAFGEFSQSDYQTITNMLQVNVTSLMQLTRLFLAEMTSRNRGYILNVGSMAGFVPGPLMAVYFATKAFVLSFSEALAYELKDTAVRVTVFCPGPVKSEFQRVAYRESPEVTDRRRIPTAAQMARFGYEAMKQGTTIAIPGFRNKILPIILRLIPRMIVPYFAQFRHKRDTGRVS